MKPRTVTSTLVITTIVVAGVLLLWINPTGAASAPTPNSPYGGEVIATVGGEPIFQQQAHSRVQGIESLHDLDKQFGSDWPDAIMGSIRDDTIILKEAANAGVEVNLVTVLAGTMRAEAGFGGSEALQDYLDTSDTTIAQFQMRVYMNLLAARLFLKVTEDVQVPEQAVERYFTQHRSDYEEPNDDIAYLAVKDSIREQLLKERRYEAYADWLEDKRTKPEYELEILKENWWKDEA